MSVSVVSARKTGAVFYNFIKKEKKERATFEGVDARLPCLFDELVIPSVNVKRGVLEDADRICRRCVKTRKLEVDEIILGFVCEKGLILRAFRQENKVSGNCGKLLFDRCEANCSFHHQHHTVAGAWATEITVNTFSPALQNGFTDGKANGVLRQIKKTFDSHTHPSVV